MSAQATTQTTDQPQRPTRRRVMGMRDITLYTVSAVLVIETLTSSAAVGVKTLAWWVLFLILFYVPYGLITAELATTYPEQGGIYVWVRRAFGRKAAARTTYWYWVNVAMWMPSVFVAFAGVFCQLFIHHWSKWPDGKWPQIVMAIGLTWLVVVVGMLRLEVGKHFNNVGAALKMVIIFALGIGGIVFAIRHGSANPINGSSFVPSFHVAKKFLPVIIYLMIGFELVSSMSGEIDKPEKRMPRALLTSGASIAFLYMLATVGILLALSLSKLRLIEGLVETFRAIFGRTGAGEVVVYALGIAALYTFFANMTTWTMGANRAAAEAGIDGELPKVFAREHPVRRTPVAAFAITGVVSTVILLLTAIFINEQDSLFFAIFASSSVIFLMPYLLMFPAVARLRYTDPDRHRPFRIPGGNVGVIAIVTLTTAIIAGGILLFIWPEIPHRPAEWSYTGPLLGIVVAALVVGEAIIWWVFHPDRRPHVHAVHAGPGVLHRGHPHGRPHLRHRRGPHGESATSGTRVGALRAPAGTAAPHDSRPSSHGGRPASDDDGRGGWGDDRPGAAPTRTADANPPAAEPAAAGPAETEPVKPAAAKPVTGGSAR